jgi:hypothetical protein
MSAHLVWIRLACVAALPLGFAGAAAQSTAEPNGEPTASPGGVLELVSGERIAGHLAAADDVDGFAWASPVFRTPLYFEASALRRATFEPDPATHAAEGAWRVALRNGDVVFGDLLGLDAASASLATHRHGALAVPRAAIAEIRRRAGGSAVYLGPNNALEWQQHGATSAAPWRAVATSLVSNEAGSELFRDGVFADACRAECVVSWSGNPGFRIVLCASTESDGDGTAVVIEVWGDLLMAFRDRPDKVDLVPLPHTIREQGSAHLRFSLQDGRVRFEDERGASLGELELALTPGATGITIRQEHAGELRLDRLRIERIYGAGERAPLSIAAADVRGYVAERDAFAVGEASVPAADVDLIRFQPGDASTAAAEEDERTPRAEVLLQDGTRVSGEYAGIAAGAVLLETPWGPEPVASSVAALKTLAVHDNIRPRAREQFKLVVEDDQFLGKIVAWSAQDGTLLWQPTLGKATAAMSTVEDLRLDLAGSSAYFLGQKDYPHRILFTNRDCVGCRILSITPETIAFVEPFHGARREVAAGDVKALEFDPRAVPRIAADVRVPPLDPEQERRRSRAGQRQQPRNFIDAARRETILSLPRKFKGNPPSHLLLAANGDVLRGVLDSVTSDSITLKMSLASDTAVPRDLVVAMVLFHPDAVDPAPAEQSGAEANLVLEVTLDKETRVTLQVLDADATSITGRSPFLGDVVLPYEDIVSMVSGTLRGQAQGFFTAWELTPMKEPPN